MKRRFSIFLLVLALTLTFAAAVRADTTYSMDWYTIDSGGGVMSGGAYTVTGVTGQYDSGPQQMVGQYALDGGFLGGASAVRYMQMIPIIQR